MATRLCSDVGCVAPRHYEDCGTCFGWGVRDLGGSPLAASSLEKARTEGGWRGCPECGGTPHGLPLSFSDVMDATTLMACRKFVDPAIFRDAPDLPVEERRAAKLTTSAQLVEALLATGTAVNDGYLARGVPNGARLCGAEFDPIRRQLVLYFEHESFPVVVEGGTPDREIDVRTERVPLRGGKSLFG